MKTTPMVFQRQMHGIASLAVILLLLCTTVMPVETRWSRAELMMAWTLPLMSLWGTACMLSAKEARRVTLLDLLIGAWGAYYLLRVWMGAEYTCATQFLKDAMTFMMYFAMRGIFSRCTASPSVATAALVACGCYEAIVGLMQIAEGDSRHHLYALTGTFLNPGPYSAYLLIAAVTVLTGKQMMLRYTDMLPKTARRFLHPAYCIILALPFLLIPATWSRAALMALAAVCLWHYRRHYWRWRYAVWGICLLLSATLYFMKQGSADGRMLTWTASVTSWLQAPWMGVGVGGFRHASAEGIAEMFAANPDNILFASGNVAEYAFCDLLTVLTEQGIVGAALSIAVTATAILNLRRWSTPLFYAMMSLLAFSLFSYPFELYPYRAIAVMLAAASANSGTRLQAHTVPLITAIAGMAVMASSIFVAREMLTRSNADREYNLFSGMHHAAFINDYYELLPKESDNSLFLFNFAKTLRTAGRHNESNAMLRQGTSISNDPMFYLLQGNNYCDMQCHDLAEKAYIKAYAVMPNRLYPLYRLMTLYESTGQLTKMRRTAKRIINARCKVESKATKDIIEKAKEAL